MAKNKQACSKRIKARVVVVGLLLFLFMCGVVGAAILSMVQVQDNVFQNARVEIDLNGGRSIFDGSDMNIEPGMRLKRDFTVTNNSTVEVWYRLYLENISGELVNAIDLAIYDGDRLLYSSAMADMDADGAFIAESSLGVGETVILTALVTMRETSGNEFKSQQLSFDMRADAVQVRNNPDKLFD